MCSCLHCSVAAIAYQHLWLVGCGALWIRGTAESTDKTAVCANAGQWVQCNFMRVGTMLQCYMCYLSVCLQDINMLCTHIVIGAAMALIAAQPRPLLLAHFDVLHHARDHFVHSLCSRHNKDGI